MKKILALGAVCLLCAGFFAYIWDLSAPEPVPPATTQPTATKGQVLFSNPDPHLQAAWEALAAEYTALTGVPVRIAPSALLGDTTPTLFCVESQEELNEYADVCVELAGTNATHHLRAWNLAMYADKKLCALPAQIEGLGLIYNQSHLHSIGKTGADITSFAKLSEAVQMIDGTSSLKFAPFSCVNLDGTEMALLAAMPGDIRPFWDLYTTYTSCDELAYPGSNTHDEILAGDAAFCIGSTDEFGLFAQMSESNLNIMPLYIGMEGEANQGLCVRVKNYWCVRNDVPQADIDATLDFLDYLTHPVDGKTPVDTLEICTPYTTSTYASTPLEMTLRGHLSSGKKLVVINRTAAPEGFAAALMAYAKDPTDDNWAAVTQLLNET